jgi:hypothetical protein
MSIITKAPLARFFGGQAIEADLPSPNSWNATGLNIGLATLLQLILVVVKKVHAWRFDTYVTNLQRTILENMLNVFSTKASCLVLALGGFYYLLHKYRGGGGPLPEGAHLHNDLLPHLLRRHRHQLIQEPRAQVQLLRAIDP